MEKGRPCGNKEVRCAERTAPSDHLIKFAAAVGCDCFKRSVLAEPVTSSLIS
jgi:hypothetical protein